MARKLRVRWQVTEEFEGTFDPEALGMAPDAGDDPNVADFETEVLAEFEDVLLDHYIGTPDRSTVSFEWVEV